MVLVGALTGQAKHNESTDVWVVNLADLCSIQLDLNRVKVGLVFTVPAIVVVVLGAGQLGAWIT